MALNFLNNGYFAGKVGIGTNSPDAKLHIEGGIGIFNVTDDWQQSSLGTYLFRGANFATTISNETSTLKIFPVEDGNRAVGKYWGGINFMHLDPENSSWGTSFTGSQFWIGGRVTSLSGQELSALVFATNSSGTAGSSPTEKMVILPNGNVGIGATNPSYQLSIENHATTTSTAIMELDGKRTDGNDGPVGELIFSNNGDTFATVVGSRDGADNSGSIVFQTQDSGTFGTRMTISSDGNVGIGVSNPETSRLLVRGSTNDSNSQIFQAANLAGNTRYAIRPDGDNKWYKSDSSLSMTITSDGNVGIGATAVTAPGFWYDATNKYLAISHWATPPTPAALLHLSDNANDIDVPQIRIEGRENPGDTKLDISVKDPDVRFNLIENTPDANAGYGLMIFKTNAVANSANPTRGGFNFQTTAASSSLFITNEAKVGIGTSSPIHPLYVNGDIGQSDGSRIWFRGSSSSSATGAQSYVYSNGLNLQIKGDDNVQILGDGGGIIAHFDYTGKVGISTTLPKSKLQVDGGIQMADDTDTAVADKAGTMRYRTGTEYVEVTGTELITNGDFASDTSWSKQTGWTVSGGTGNCDGTSTNALLFQNNIFITGKIYNINFEITSYTSGVLRLRDNGVLLPTNYTAIGSYTLILTATQTGFLGFQNYSSFIGSIDNVSVIEVTAEDASYADMCMQTGSSTYEWVNIVRNTY